MHRSHLTVAILVALAAGAALAQDAAPPQQPAGVTPVAPQQPARGRNPAPTRDPQTPGYVAATMLPDGAVPPADAIGNFVIGPTHNPAPEMMVQPGVPQGTIHNFTMESKDSKIYPGIARVAGSRSMVDPNRDPLEGVVEPMTATSTWLSPLNSAKTFRTAK